jgi:hypothetical protein
LNHFRIRASTTTGTVDGTVEVVMIVGSPSQSELRCPREPRGASPQAAKVAATAINAVMRVRVRKSLLERPRRRIYVGL